MRFVVTRKLILITVLAVVFSLGAGWTVLRAGTVPDDAQARAAWFLKQVEKLANSGRIDDLNFVGKTLGTKFTSQPNHRSYNSENCAVGRSGLPSLDFTKMSPSGEFWYRSQPGGTEQHVPGMFINPSYVTGEPGFSYDVKDVTWCNPPPSQVVHEHEATLGFHDVPGFVCIDEPMLTALLPKVRQSFATDGVNPYHYDGAVDDRTGSSVEFTYRFGARCLLDVRIFQSIRDGYKQKRAWAKHDLCRIEKLRAICAKGDTSPQDSLSRIDRADKECPTVQWLVDHEPNSNEPPLELDYLAVTDAEMCRPHTDRPKR